MTSTTPVALIFAMLMGQVLPGALLASQARGRIAFERHELSLDTGQRQTLVTGFLLGGPVADLAILTVDRERKRRLAIYSLADEGWVPKLEVPLSSRVSFVDVIEVCGRDRLVAHEPDRLTWFEPQTREWEVLARVETSYDARPSGLSYASGELVGPTDAGELPRVEVSQDLNGDGREDLIIPDLEGFWVSIQQECGVFTQPRRIGPPEPYLEAKAFGDARTYGEVGITPLTIPWYLSRVHRLDYNRDGRPDLAFWNEDHFEVYLQDAEGGFAAEPESFRVDAPFDGDGTYSLLFALGDRSPLALVLGLGPRLERRVLRGFLDINGDGVEDLVTSSLEGRSLLRLRTGYRVYYGVATDGGVVFDSEPDTSVRTRGKAPSGYSFHELRDFDGDGQVDLGSMNVRTGVDKMIRAMLGTSITMSFELYRARDGLFPREPTAQRAVRLDIDVRDGRDGHFFPPVLAGDVNGDGSADLLVGRNREELLVYLGGPYLLKEGPHPVAVTLPGNERHTWLTDLNRDGKQDVIMHHDRGPQPNRVTTLIVR